MRYLATMNIHTELKIVTGNAHAPTAMRQNAQLFGSLAMKKATVHLLKKDPRKETDALFRAVADAQGDVEAAEVAASSERESLWAGELDKRDLAKKGVAREICAMLRKYLINLKLGPYELLTLWFGYR